MRALDNHFKDVKAGKVPLPNTIMDLPEDLRGEIGRLELRRILAQQYGQQHNFTEKDKNWVDPDILPTYDWAQNTDEIRPFTNNGWNSNYNRFWDNWLDERHGVPDDHPYAEEYRRMRALAESDSTSNDRLTAMKAAWEEENDGEDWGYGDDAKPTAEYTQEQERRDLHIAQERDWLWDQLVARGDIPEGSKKPWKDENDNRYAPRHTIKMPLYYPEQQWLQQYNSGEMPDKNTRWQDYNEDDWKDIVGDRLRDRYGMSEWSPGDPMLDFAGQYPSSYHGIIPHDADDDNVTRIGSHWSDDTEGLSQPDQYDLRDKKGEWIPHPLAGKPRMRRRLVGLGDNAWKPVLAETGFDGRSNDYSYHRELKANHIASPLFISDELDFIAEREGITPEEARLKYETYDQNQEQNVIHHKRRGSKGIRESPMKATPKEKWEYDPVTRAIAQAFMDSDMERIIDDDENPKTRMRWNDADIGGGSFGSEPHGSEYQDETNRGWNKDDLPYDKVQPKWDLASYMRQLTDPRLAGVSRNRSYSNERTRKSLNEILREITDRRIQEQDDKVEYEED